MKTIKTLSMCGIVALAGVYAFAHNVALANFFHKRSSVVKKIVHSRSVQQKKAASVDINHADVKTLMRLKGVGKRRAESIVAYRRKQGPFRTVSELSKVKGISDKRLAQLIKKNPRQITLGHPGATG